MVPLGPNLCLRMSYNPQAVLMSTANTVWAWATSVLGCKVFTADQAEE